MANDSGRHAASADKPEEPDKNKGKSQAQKKKPDTPENKNAAPSQAKPDTPARRAAPSGTASKSAAATGGASGSSTGGSTSHSVKSGGQKSPAAPKNKSASTGGSAGSSGSSSVGQSSAGVSGTSAGASKDGVSQGLKRDSQRASKAQGAGSKSSAGGAGVSGASSTPGASTGSASAGSTGGTGSAGNVGGTNGASSAAGSSTSGSSSSSSSSSGNTTSPGAASSKQESTKKLGQGPSQGRALGSGSEGATKGGAREAGADADGGKKVAPKTLGVSLGKNKSESRGSSTSGEQRAGDSAQVSAAGTSAPGDKNDGSGQASAGQASTGKESASPASSSGGSGLSGTSRGSSSSGNDGSKGPAGTAGRSGKGASQTGSTSSTGGSSLTESTKEVGNSAIRGAAKGSTGGAHGMAVGAAQEVGKEGLKKGLDSVGLGAGDGKAGSQGEAGAGDSAPVMGAAGTSAARDQPDGGPEGGSAAPLGKKVKRAAVVGGAALAPQAAGLIVLLAFLNWLKSFFFSMLAKTMGLLQALWGWVTGAVKAVGHAIAAPFVAIGTGVANLFAGGIAAGTFLASSVAMTTATAILLPLTMVGLVGGLFSAVTSNANSRNAGFINSEGMCVTGNATTVGDQPPVSETVEKNAQDVYSVLSSWGMPDENIAGILGNWANESGLDPTSVEGIFTEPYHIGPRKQAAWDGGFRHMSYLGGRASGIGMGQWTGGRNELLISYAQEQGQDWHGLGLQLKFMADPSGDNPGDVTVFRSMINESKGTPAQAATFFHDNWERSADTPEMIANRGEKADYWYGKMSGWSVDQGVVEELVGDFVSGVEDVVHTVFNSGCGTGTSGDGSGSDNVSLVGGGMNQEQAQGVIDLYKQEGDAFLRAIHKGGGPGQCDGNYLQNCVSFSIYFMNKYTTFGGYASGNGQSTAGSVATATGLTTSKTPTAYAIFSIAGGTGYYGSAGHTGVVMGVSDDGSLVVAQAGYCRSPGEVILVPKATWQSENWTFVDVSSLLKDGGDIEVA